MAVKVGEVERFPPGLLMVEVSGEEGRSWVVEAVSSSVLSPKLRG